MRWSDGRSGFWLDQDDPNCNVIMHASNMDTVSGNALCDGRDKTKAKTQCGAGVHVVGWNCRTKWMFEIRDGKLRKQKIVQEPPAGVPAEPIGCTFNIITDASQSSRTGHVFDVGVI
jgi:hypothetical protein